MLVPLTSKEFGTRVWCDLENNYSLWIDVKGGTFRDNSVPSVCESPEEIVAIMAGSCDEVPCEMLELTADDLSLIHSWGDTTRVFSSGVFDDIEVALLNKIRVLLDSMKG